MSLLFVTLLSGETLRFRLTAVNFVVFTSSNNFSFLDSVGVLTASTFGGDCIKYQFKQKRVRNIFFFFFLKLKSLVTHVLVAVPLTFVYVILPL